MEAFVGRTAELETLNHAYHASSSGFLPIYGRRRVGKTELLVHFTKNKPSVFFHGKEASTNFQIREFLEIAADVLEEPLLAELGDVGWKKALQYVVARAPEKQKFVLVLDEFQWIAAASPELPSIIQELWDREWKRSHKVLLILCGSYIGFMEREVLGKKSPLFGRRTGQILLQPFGFREAAAFHPNYSLADQARVWALCGGIPYYLSLFDRRQSVSSNIQALFLTPHAPLYREADFLIREELREVERYHALLMALAGGAQAAKTLAQQTGIPHGNIAYYLNVLIELGYVTKRYPLTSRRPSVQSVRYALMDPLLRFWFRFGFPQLSKFVTLKPPQAYDKAIKPHIESYYGERFEALCREALPQLYLHWGIDAAHEIGEYWDKQVQIDLVSVRDDGWIDLGECKWGTIRSWSAVIRESKDKLAAYPNPDGHTLAPILFTRLKSTQHEREGVRCVDLDQLYGA